MEISIRVYSNCCSSNKTITMLALFPKVRHFFFVWSTYRCHGLIDIPLPIFDDLPVRIRAIGAAGGRPRYNIGVVGGWGRAIPDVCVVHLQGAPYSGPGAETPTIQHYMCIEIRHARRKLWSHQPQNGVFVQDLESRRWNNKSCNEASHKIWGSFDK